MLTHVQMYVSPKVQRQIINEVYIEKIDDVLAEYVALFIQYPSKKHDKKLSKYYSNLCLLIKSIRFGTVKYNQHEIDDYLQDAYVEILKAKVLAKKQETAVT